MVGLFGKRQKKTAAYRSGIVAPKEVAPKRAPSRGWAGAGRGSVSFLDKPNFWRGSTFQVCGLYPFAAGSPAPVTGVPIGLHLEADAAVCCDPIAWFSRARLISNPSAFVLGIPGLGKSTIVRRMMIGTAYQGVIPLVLGDTKPDHVDVIRALGGQVIEVGPGAGSLNVLDPGEAIAAAEKLEAAGHIDLAERLRSESRDLRLTMVCSLITLARRQAPTDREEAIVERALQILDREFVGVPVLRDLLDVIKSGHDELLEMAVAHGKIERYHELTEALVATVQGLLGSSRFGKVFSEHTTTPMLRDRAVVFDVSNVSENNPDLQAAILLACWSYGFGTVRVAEALAAAGLEKQRHYFVVLDEVWKTLRAGEGMVERIDALTRLNRQRGVGQVMITHTVSDLELPTAQQTAMAKGFIERSGIVICAGLPDAEMDKLQEVVRFSKAERNLVVSWKTPPGWDSDYVAAEPPGMGKFLIKVGGRSGLPVRVVLTPSERAVNDTNKKWSRTMATVES